MYGLVRLFFLFSMVLFVNAVATSKFTSERFVIRAIDYDFDCEGGIFGISIFTRLTGGSVAIILDPPRTDGLTHEQAYHELLRRLEEGDVQGAAELYDNEETRVFFQAIAGVNATSLISNCTEAIFAHYIRNSNPTTGGRMTVNYLTYLEEVHHSEGVNDFSGSMQGRLFWPERHRENTVYRFARNLIHIVCGTWGQR
ncbi:hypothetical protein V1527DRAFT_479551 [Lipomyces starkeyi]